MYLILPCSNLVSFVPRYCTALHLIDVKSGDVSDEIFPDKYVKLAKKNCNINSRGKCTQTLAHTSPLPVSWKSLTFKTMLLSFYS